MKIYHKVWQKEYESHEWFKEELIYFDRDKNEWITEVWKFTKNEEGDIEETILEEEKKYSRGSKPIIEKKFPWLKHRKTWNIKYQPKKY